MKHYFENDVCACGVTTHDVYNGLAKNECPLTRDQILAAARLGAGGTKAISAGPGGSGGNGGAKITWVGENSDSISAVEDGCISADKPAGAFGAVGAAGGMGGGATGPTGDNSDFHFASIDGSGSICEVTEDEDLRPTAFDLERAKNRYIKCVKCVKGEIYKEGSVAFADGKLQFIGWSTSLPRNLDCIIRIGLNALLFDSLPVEH